MFSVSDNWLATYPDAHAGILVMRAVENPSGHPGLERAKREVEADLRERFAGLEMGALESYDPIPAYSAYYRAFRKTYHVLGQLRSVIFDGKSIPSVAALVEAMFMAELKNGLLTAGHDLDVVRLPARLDAAAGSERYTTLSGQERTLKAGDMYIADQEGVLSSIIYGPDLRTRITADTTSVLYTVYAPAGVGAERVREHLDELCRLVQLFSPAAAVSLMHVFGASA